MCCSSIDLKCIGWFLDRHRLRIREYLGSKPPSVTVTYHKSKVEIGRAFSRKLQGGLNLL